MSFYTDKDPDEYRAELLDMGATDENANAAIEYFLRQREELKR